MEGTGPKPAEEPPADLCCPISLELLEDPVTTPCCGRSFSRASLSAHLDNNSVCPLCRARIKKKFPSWNVHDVAPSRNLIAMVEHWLLTKKAIESGSPVLPPRLVLDDDPVWNCTVSPVLDHNKEELPISITKLGVNWPTYDGDVCMLIPVIDKSGSMGGKPFDQVKQALLHMHYLTFTNRHVFTCLILYDSKAEKIMVPRDGDLTTARAKAVEEQIKTMSANGGTNFSAAFKMIQEVLLGTKDNQGNWQQGAPVTVTSAVVVFMTDGQDNTYYGKPGGNDTLVNQFKQNLKDWKKPLTVHTVGFSTSHDYDFLDKLRKAGSTEGAFRYAEPNDEGDTLCQKMSDLATSIISNTALQATVYTPYPLYGGFRPSELVPATSRYHKNALTKYKTDLSFDMDEGRGKLSLFIDAKASEVQSAVKSFIIEIGRRDFEFGVNCELDNPDKELFQEWISYLAKHTVQQTLHLANASNRTTTAYLLRCSLLLKQARAIALYVRTDEGLTAQLQMCISQLEALLGGKQISVARLSDVAQSTAVKPTTTTTTTSTAPSATSAVIHSAPLRQYQPSQPVTENEFLRDCGASRSDLHKAVTNGKLVDLEALASSNASLCLVTDSQGNTPLMYACCIGRINCIEILYLAHPGAQTLCNAGGFLPLDIAVLCGKWRTVEILLRLGATNGKDGQELIKKVVGRGYYKTAGCLLAHGFGSISIDMFQNDLPAATLEWIMEKKAEKAIQSKVESIKGATTTTTTTAPPAQTAEELTLCLRNAVQNGMTKLVKSLLANDIPLTLDLLFLCGPKGEAGADVAELLIEKGLNPDKDDGSLNLPPDQQFEPPLFRAAEKGWDQLLLVLINAKANVNWQNKAGNTPLWIACMNKNLECIAELLNAGADPNLANNRGDLPLMCASQRNMTGGVSALLAAGAKIDQTDPAVNSPLMVCCRCGHDVILETLLSKLLKEKDGEERIKNQIELRATIDGFNLLIAAAEQNRFQCIKILKNYKADLEFKTTPENPILASATALHVAVYYGMVEAAVTLLELGANVNSRDAIGRTPLHLAVLQSNSTMVRVLKSFKADFSCKDDAGNVASFYASSSEVKTEMDDPSLKYLILLAQSGTVDPALLEIIKRDSSVPGILHSAECVNVSSGDGWSVLMESTVFGNDKFSKLLVELGADPLQTDTSGLSAVFWASLFGRDQETFFGKSYELSKIETVVLEQMETLKKTDVRNALLFDIETASIAEESLQANNKENHTGGSEQERGFLHQAMNFSKDKLHYEQPLEIPKTRSKCSVGSFVKSLDDKALGVAGASRSLGPNLILLRSAIATAKLYTAKVGAGEEIKVGEEELGLQELAALNLISSNATVFSSMNKGFSGNKTWPPFISLVIRSLELLPQYEGELYRGVNFSFVPSSWEVGKEVLWSTLTSCTSSWYELLDKEASRQTESSFKYNLMFLIRAPRYARSLSGVSSCPNFCPAVLLPNAKFVVKSLHVASVIALGQPGIRDTAYKMSPQYLEQASKKSKPIFVVLEEI